MVYNFLSRIMESGYCRYTSFVVRQDIDANTFVGAKHSLFWRQHFLTEKSKLMENTAGFLFFPSFVDSGTTNTNVECTRALRHLVTTYYTVQNANPCLHGFFVKLA